MDEAFISAWSLLTQSPWHLLLSIFWFVIIFEVPRYCVSFVAAASLYRKIQRIPLTPERIPNIAKISIILVGHNEAATLWGSVMSVRAQIATLPKGMEAEIICVSDGSTDSSPTLIRHLKRQKLIDVGLVCDLRGGKASALNLATRIATGDVFITIDSDSRLEKNAILHILSPLCDPSIGAVAGHVEVGNAKASIATALQAIEYALTIMLSKTLMSAFDQVTVVSGAFGAFRRSAWEHVHGCDAGSGEDLDLTLRLREAGFGIAFASGAVCSTRTPTTFQALFRQRCRWERDALWIRLRKHGATCNPFHPRFQLKEAVHQVEFIVFNVLATLLFPFYLLTLIIAYHDIVPMIMLAMLGMAWFVDLVNFTCLIFADPQRASKRLRLLPFMLIYSPFQTVALKLVRLYAYIDEFVFAGSARDDFVPRKVNLCARSR